MLPRRTSGRLGPRRPERSRRTTRERARGPLEHARLARRNESAASRAGDTCPSSLASARRTSTETPARRAKRDCRARHDGPLPPASPTPTQTPCRCGLATAPGGFGAATNFAVCRESAAATPSSAARSAAALRVPTITGARLRSHLARPPGPIGLERRRAGSNHVAPVPPHLRLAHDRGGCDREGPRTYMVTRASASP
jgi:hypothetical protein